ncbi:MAG TPA: glutamate--tRNA ligase, partial [Oceanicaulis sp.]|nr:glutamate--tRNA ligase [Oceanicaulis sp.]
MTVKVRFAPSPTGKLHVGNVRTALMNVLFARGQGGQVLLRIDDTDLERSTAEFEDAIRADLTWLGLSWDETFKQSERFDKYETAKAALIEKGLLYPCYETEDELDRKRKIQRAQGKPPVYDRAALNLSDAEKAKLRDERGPGVWRFKLDQERIEWKDGILGDISIDAASVSDPVLIRGDGQILYTLASVVDDTEMGVTNVVRGSDHVTNTATQIQIMQALGGIVPTFAHHSLL